MNLIAFYSEQVNKLLKVPLCHTLKDPGGDSFQSCDKIAGVKNELYLIVG